MSATPTRPFSPQTPQSALSPLGAGPSQSMSRRTSAMSAGANTEQRRARRAELRQFYGIKGDQAPQAGSSQNGRSLNIDATGFDATAYLDDLVARASLGELMNTATKLSADVGNLQGSRHALVYNHHHQLFEAGDTISHLNSRTPQLLGIMTSLQQSFSEISRLAEEVSLGGPESAGDEKPMGKRDIERLRLMVTAEESPEEIHKRFEVMKEQLEKADEEDAKRALEECQAIVDGIVRPIPAITVDTGV